MAPSIVINRMVMPATAPARIASNVNFATIKRFFCPAKSIDHR